MIENRRERIPSIRTMLGGLFTGAMVEASFTEPQEMTSFAEFGIELAAIGVGLVATREFYNRILIPRATRQQG